MDNHEKVLYDDGTHKCVMFAFDDESHEDSFLSASRGVSDLDKDVSDVTFQKPLSFEDVILVMQKLENLK